MLSLNNPLNKTNTVYCLRSMYCSVKAGFEALRCTEYAMKKALRTPNTVLQGRFTAKYL